MSMRFSLLIVVAVLAAGCGGGGSQDAGPGADDAGAVDCTHDARVLAYAPGVSVSDSAGDRSYVLVDGNPAPPTRGNNTWTVRVNDSAGHALSGLSLDAAAFMPDHGHGSSVTPEVTPQGDGSYAVGPLYFFMPGVWRVTLSDADGGSAAENGVFFFCVEG